MVVAGESFDILPTWPMSATDPINACLPPADRSTGLLGTALSSPRIAGLDFLRALAVLTVLVAHSVVNGSNPGVPLDGVELFFVISGFLITWLLLLEFEASGTVSFGAFFRRRAARLLPPFYAYLVISLAYLAWRDKPIPWGAVGAACAYVVNYYQALTGAPTHFLSHCWSLAVEEQFYFLWPFALLFLMRKGIRLENALIGAILFVWALRPLLYLGLHVSDEYVYRALETRADHLAAGCLLAVLLRKPVVLAFVERCARNWVVVSSLLLLLLLSRALDASLAYKYSVGFAIEALLMAVLIPIVILLAQGPGWAAALINTPVLVLMGEASYGIYLFHPMLMSPVAHGVEGLTHSSVVGMLASIAVVMLVALASLRFFENPIRRRFRGR